ncbi:sensor histidine kinase [Frigoribacterium sp. 2-23]|uniref:sensor histidine kinase n=1 Tax=Frigoribacterium sp. 2-23 TaxID=3415006 RepID=UPI003C6F9BB5
MPTATDGTTRAAPPLERMRRYTTWSLVWVALVFVLVLLPQMPTLPIGLAVAAAGAVVAVQSLFWERGGPRLLVVAALVSSYAVWCLAVVGGASGFAVVPFALSAALVATTPPHIDVRLTALAIVLAILPPLVVASESERWGTTVAAIILMISAWGTYRLSRYQFGLYLEVDSLRQSEAELAVLRERYRFSSDLHDIQGHTLYVSRLQLQLAGKMLDRDIDAARAHVAEAEQLIAQTIAETRRLAYGERTVTLAGELANSTALIEAAGIELRVDGVAPAGHPLDALFGHLVREATTNLLRHAEARRVVVELSAGGVAVVNDGAGANVRPLRGLARLAERFRDAGGVLTTRHDGGEFRTEARAQDARPEEARVTSPRTVAGVSATVAGDSATVANSGESVPGGDR